MEKIQVNTNEDGYFDKHFNIALWCGCGYWLQVFDVYANFVDEALELIVSWCEKNDYKGYLLDVENIEDEDEDGLLYVDATMNGASKPYYIYSENLRINEI